MGIVTLNFTVAKGPFGTNNIVCSPAQQCYIAVSTFQTGDSVQFGIACAIGLLPTSLLGVAPTRKRRLIYGVVGCLFGVGVMQGDRDRGRKS